MLNLEDYKHRLDQADLEDDFLFHNLLEEGFRLLSLTNKDIVHEFGTSISTVIRWRKGENRPYPVMRKPVYDYLKKRVSECI